MIQEEKQLLLKDLCMRLPYGVKVWNSEFLDSIEEYYPNETLTLSDLDYYIKESIEVKPYLRPLSSMMDEENKYYNKLTELVRDGEAYEYEVVDWLNENDFDYRGLIEKNLAFEMPKSMYKTK